MFDPGTDQLSLEELAEIVREVHDAALRITTKAGDEWAIVSYSPRRERFEYFNAVYKYKPMLAHRFTANVSSLRLSDEQKLAHAATAYLMLRRQYPDIDIELESYINEQKLGPFGYLLPNDDGRRNSYSFHSIPDVSAHVENIESLEFPWQLNSTN